VVQLTSTLRTTLRLACNFDTVTPLTLHTVLVVASPLNIEKLRSWVRAIQFGGSTNFSAPLLLAYDMIKATQAKVEDPSIPGEDCSAFVFS
jgi:hypothetical protein